MNIQIAESCEAGLAPNAVPDFYAKHWKRKTALALPAFYQYQFCGSPQDPGRDHCVVAFDADSGELYGVMGLNQRPFFLRGQEVPGAEISSWIVDESLQGHGIGKRILDKLTSLYDAIVGMGISAAAIPLYMRRGFRFLHAIPRFVRVYNLENTAQFAKIELLAEKLVVQWADQPKVKYLVEEYRPTGMHNICSHVEPILNSYTKRPEYIDWRYSRHPAFKYETYIVKADVASVGAFVCMRVEGALQGLKLLHVIDLYGDGDDLRAAVAFIEDYARDNGIDIADCFALNTDLNRHFYSSGWFSTLDDSCFQFAHLFHPYELRVPPTTSMCFWSASNLPELSQLSKLSICKGDCDLDRPTAETFSRAILP